MELQGAFEIALNVSMLTAASIYDLRDREIPDHIWLMGILLGMIIRFYYFREAISYLSKAYPLLLLLGVLLLIEWRLSLSGEADVLAYASLIVTDTGFTFALPSPLIVYLLSKVIVLLLIPLQFLINVARVTRDPKLLEGFNEPIWRKILALFLLSPYSKHFSKGASIAEVLKDGERKFVLSASLLPLKPGEVEERGKWIAPTYPMMPTILLAYVISILC